MPRKRRFFLPGVPAHIVQRGRSRQPVFFADDDYQAYLHWLAEAGERYKCAIHAYVLMTNHVHILATPRESGGLSQMMQYLGRRYVPYINRRYSMSGSIWEGRYKASLVDDEMYLLRCMRYVELNPVRANMVVQAGHYRWSSYRINAQGASNTLISPHALYLALGKTGSQRLAAYKAVVKAGRDDSHGEINSAWQTGTPLGGERFKAAIERQLRCGVGQNRRGRPSGVDKAIKGL